MSDLTFLTLTPVTAIIKNQSAVQRGLLFLWKFAWKSRLRLPYLIVIAFMILDLRVTLEVIVDMPPDDNDEEDLADDDSDTSAEYFPDYSDNENGT